jgi:hypothetical protein
VGVGECFWVMCKHVKMPTGKLLQHLQRKRNVYLRTVVYVRFRQGAITCNSMPVCNEPKSAYI